MKAKIVKISIVISILALAIYLYDHFTQSNLTNNKTLTLYGNVDIREVNLGFRVSGKLQDVYFDEGDFIKQGAFLAKLDTKPYKEKVWKAKADAESSKISTMNAKKQFQRRQLASASSAVSEEEYENAFVNYEELKANYEAMEATLATATTEFEDCFLYAPSDGYILTRIKEPGSILSVGDPVFTMTLCNPVWIRAYVDEPNLGKIYPGMKAAIYTDSGEFNQYYGHIGFISSVAEFTPKNVESPELRTDLVFRLRIIVDNPDKGLRQGMPVTIKLLNENESKQEIKD